MTDFQQSAADRRDGDRRALLPPALDNGWHLDKKVPISLIVAMTVQLIGIVMYLAQMKQDIELLKQDTASLHVRDTTNSDSLREALRTMQEQFTRLDGKLDRLIERGQK
jgi:Tfp pilus assembly protein PilO